MLRYIQLLWEGYRTVLEPPRESAYNRRQMMNTPAPYNAHVSFANFSLKLGIIASMLSKSNLAWDHGIRESNYRRSAVTNWIKSWKGYSASDVRKLTVIIWKLWRFPLMGCGEFLQVQSALHHFQAIPFSGVDSVRQRAWINCCVHLESNMVNMKNQGPSSTGQLSFRWWPIECIAAFPLTLFRSPT